MFPAMPNVDPMLLAALMRGQPGSIPNMGPQMPTPPAPGGMGGMRPPMMQPPMPPTAPGGAGGILSNPAQMMAMLQMLKGQPTAAGYRQFPNSPFGSSPGGASTYMPPFAPAAGGQASPGLLSWLGFNPGAGASPGGG